MADETEQKPVDKKPENTEPSTAKKPAAKKATTRKPAAQKIASTPDGDSPTVETTKKSAAKKPAVKKPAAKKETTDIDAPKVESTQKSAVKKPVTKKSTATPEDPTSINKKTAAKKTATPKPITQKTESDPKSTATKKKTAPAKVTDLPEAEPAPEVSAPGDAAHKPAAKETPIKNYEASEGRKSARGRVAKKVDDTRTPVAALEVATPETTNAKPDKSDNKKADKKKDSKKTIVQKSADKVPEAPRTKAAEVVETTTQPTPQTLSESDHTGQHESRPDVKPQQKKAEEKESTPQELLERGAQWLKELFVHMNLKAKVETREQDTDLLFNVSVAQDSPASENLSVHALESIQTLLADVLSERGIGRIVVDIDGFLQNRDTELATIASKLAKTARKINGAITIAGFNAHERRVIHQNLEGEKDLKTESTDVGSFRKLRIFNKK